MLDRQKLEVILTRRFPEGSPQQVAAAANAIMGLDDEWEEFTSAEEVPAFQFTCEGRDPCRLARDFARGSAFRLLRRRDL